jgi:glycosyltransferase involved in cell wall biosynthesis
MENQMLISIVIPVRNEEKYIQICVESVLGFLIPEGIETEIIIVDGDSNDSTVSIVGKIIKKNPHIKIFNNPKRIQAAALNIAILSAKGDYILRLDAHSVYPQDYLAECVRSAKTTKADNVGGLFITQPGGNNYQAYLVQALTTHPFGVGNAGFRIGMKSDWADTVPYGFYKKSIFDKLGLIDERLVRAQDYEFNRRIIKSGGKIWRDTNIKVFYYNQKTFTRFLKKQIMLEAPYNAYMWYLAPYTFAYRHAITGVFTAGIILGAILSIYSHWISLAYSGVLILYILLAVTSAIQQSKRFKRISFILTLPISFFLYHFIHGLGVLGGLVKIMFKMSPVQKIREPWEGYSHFRVRLKKHIGA